MIDDDTLLLAVLNSAPVVDGRATDRLVGESGAQLARRFGGTGSPRELARLQRTRDALQSAIRSDGSRGADELTSALSSVVRVPQLTPAGVRWDLQGPADELLSARAVLAWSAVNQQLPGRMRACANTECNLFLIDRSRPGTAKWCSMATCGNRMKARAHAERTRA